MLSAKCLHAAEPLGNGGWEVNVACEGSWGGGWKAMAKLEGVWCCELWVLALFNSALSWASMLCCMPSAL